jgi:hypothetical protein
MRFSTKHTRENNESYLQHMCFALKAATLFFVSSIAFIIHAILPWVVIPDQLNLDAMCKNLQKERD